MACPTVAVKLTTAGENATVGIGPTPEPVNETVLLTLPARFSDPEKFPAADGVKVKEISHVAFGARLSGQLFVSVKLGSPEIEIPLIVNGVLPVLIISIWPIAFWPTVTGWNSNVDGSKTNAGFVGAGVVPVATRIAVGTPAKANGGSAFVVSLLAATTSG
jgi:hypothetical protein